MAMTRARSQRVPVKRHTSEHIGHHTDVDIGALTPLPWQIRVGEDAAFRELVDSVRERGILEPLLVRPTRSLNGAAGPSVGSPGSYQIVAGRRRFNAVKWLLDHEPNRDWRAGTRPLNLIPVIIREIEDVDAILLELNAEQGRLGWSPFEVLRAIHAVVEAVHRKEPRATQVEIAAKTGLSQSDISEAKAASRLTENDFRGAGLTLENGDVDYEAVRALTRTALVEAARAETYDRRIEVLQSGMPRMSAARSALKHLLAQELLAAELSAEDLGAASPTAEVPVEPPARQQDAAGAVPRVFTFGREPDERRMRTRQTASSETEVAKIAEDVFWLVTNGEPYRGARFRGKPSSLSPSRRRGLVGSYAGTLIALAEGSGTLAEAPVVVRIPGYRVTVERDDSPTEPCPTASGPSTQ